MNGAWLNTSLYNLKKAKKKNTTKQGGHRPKPLAKLETYESIVRKA